MRMTDEYISDLGPEQPVHDLILDLIGQQVIPCPGGTLYVPSRPHEGVSWDSSVGSTGALKVILDRKVTLHTYDKRPADGLRCETGFAGRRICLLFLRHLRRPRYLGHRLHRQHGPTLADYPKRSQSRATCDGSAHSPDAWPHSESDLHNRFAIMVANCQWVARWERCSVGPESGRIHAVNLAWYRALVRGPSSSHQREHGKWTTAARGRGATYAVPGIHCHMFARSTVVTHHQCPPHCVARSHKRCPIATLPSCHIHGFPRARLLSYRPPCYGRSGRNHYFPNMEYRLDTRRGEGTMGICRSKDAQGEVREPSPESDPLRYRTQICWVHRQSPDVFGTD